MTTYVIFWSADGEGEWTQLAGYKQARSARSAIKDYAESNGSDLGEGYWAAAPLRSWQPVKVTAETKTQLRFS